MKARMTPLAVAVSLFAATAYAADPNLGSWKLDEARSKIPAGTGKNTSVVYEPAGDSMKCTVEGVDKEGKPVHNEWTGKTDGKDYPVTGDATVDTRSLKKVDEHHNTVVNKKAGKVTVTGNVVFAKDFKTRTLTLSGKDKDGKPITGTWVYNRQ